MLTVDLFKWRESQLYEDWPLMQKNAPQRAYNIVYANLGNNETYFENSVWWIDSTNNYWVALSLSIRWISIRHIMFMNIIIEMY